MAALIEHIGRSMLGTIKDILPIIVILVAFQIGVLRQPIAHLKQVLIGFGYVTVGLALFLIGLEQALFPIGRSMAEQLTSPDFIMGGAATAEAVGI